MPMVYKVSTFILIIFLTTNLRAENSSVDLALRFVLTDINRIESFVSQAAYCYENYSLDEYQEKFCRNHQPYMYSFTSVSSHLEQEKNQSFIRWQGYLGGSVAPDYARPILKIINDNYQSCVNERQAREEEIINWTNNYYQDDEDLESYGLSDLDILSNASQWDEDLEEDESNQVNTSLIGIFLPQNYNGRLSLNPQYFNQRLLSLESYGNVLSDSESREMIRQAVVQASDLRAKILSQNPILLRYMIGQTPRLNSSPEIFWAGIQEATGLNPAQIPSDIRDDYIRIQRFRNVLNNLIEDRGYIFPENEESERHQGLEAQYPELKLTRNSLGQIDINLNSTDEAQPQARLIIDDALLLRELGGSYDDLVRTFYLNRRFSTPLTFDNPDMDELMEIFNRYEDEIREFDSNERNIRDRYILALDQQADNNEGSSEVGNEPYDDDFCTLSRDNQLREVSDRDYVIGFYNNQTNRSFIENQFNRARDIMGATIDRLNLSRGSRLGMRRLLSDVTLDYPSDLAHQNHSQFYQDLDRGIELLQLVYPDLSRFEAMERAKEFLYSENQYQQLVNFSNYDGVEGTYVLNNSYQDGKHHIRLGCGLAHPTLQANNPELYLSVLAHELGHALDPNLSITNREFYSTESLEAINELRSCLIQNNGGQYSVLSEDFADHLEGHFYTTMTNQMSNDPDWALARLRFLHHAYSAICEDRKKSFFERHNRDRYRYAHVISHPELRGEYGEFALPSIPFCPQLVAPATEGHSR
jgi:hypothetical protein